MRSVTAAATRKRRDTWSISACCATSGSALSGAAGAAASEGVQAASTGTSGATALGGAAAMSSAPAATTTGIRYVLEFGTAMSSPRGRSPDGRAGCETGLSRRLEFSVATWLHAFRQNLQRDTSPGDSGIRYRYISCLRYPSK